MYSENQKSLLLYQTILFNSTFYELASLKNYFSLQYSVYNIHNNFIQEILFWTWKSVSLEIIVLEYISEFRISNA